MGRSGAHARAAVHAAQHATRTLRTPPPRTPRRQNAPLYGKQIVGVLVTVLLSVVMTTAIYWFLYALARLVGDDLRIPEATAHDADASQHNERAYFSAVTVATPAGGEKRAPAPAAATV